MGETLAQVGLATNDPATPPPKKPSRVGKGQSLAEVFKRPAANAAPESTPQSSALSRALSWVDDRLGETDYGRAYSGAVRSAQRQMKEGLQYADRAEGPLAPIQGFGGIAEASVGALAYIFSPVTALVDQAAVKPAQAITDAAREAVISKVSLQDREDFYNTVEGVKQLEEFAIQGAAGAVGGKATLVREAEAQRAAARAIAERKAQATKEKAQAEFDKLATTDPAAAMALANHIEQVDKKTGRYLKAKIQKFVDASEEDLGQIGRDAADAAIKEMTPPTTEELIRGLHVEGDRYGTGTGEGKASPTRRPRKGGPSGYSDLATEKPEEPPHGLSTGEGAASPHRPSRPGPSGYSELGVDREAEQDPTLSVGEGKASPHRPTRPGASGYSELGTEKPPEPPAPVQRDALGTPLNKKGNPRKRIKGEVGPMPPLETRTGLSTGEGKASPHRPTKSGPSGYGDLVTEKPPNPEQLGASVRTAAKEGTEAITKEKPKAANDTSKATTVKGFVKAVGTNAEGVVPSNATLDKISGKGQTAQPPAGKTTVSVTDTGKGNFNVYVSNGQKSKPFGTFKSREEAEASANALKAQKQIPGFENPVDPGDDIIFMNNGIPITRDALHKAFSMSNELLDKIPGVTIAKAKMSRLYESYLATFNPEAIGAPARTAGAAIAKNFFDLAWREHKIWQEGKLRRNYWLKMGDDAMKRFVSQFERGVKFDNPDWERFRQDYKSWADRIYQQDMKTGFEYDRIDHYMPHLFKDGDAVVTFMQKRYGNKWADPRFIKERGYDLYEEAIRHGFTPKFKNPEEIMQARQLASDVAALRVDLLRDLASKGVARVAAKGDTRPPEGFHAETYRSPTGERYWIRDEAVAVVRNAFDSKSLWAERGVKGEVFRGYMEIKNRVVPIKLMASLYHPMHVLHIDNAAEMTRATKEFLGKPSVGGALKLLKDLSTSIPYTTGAVKTAFNTKAGYPILKVFQGKLPFEKLSDADKAAFRDLAEGGLVPTRPKEETSGIQQKFMDSLRQRSKASVFHAPWAMMAWLQHPIYNVWIPSLKIASYLKDVKVVRELNPGWTDGQRQEAFRNIARKVEARYGEMNYNSMFMNKMIKDIGVATNLSLGWNLGLLDQYAGGSIDLGRALLEKGSLKEKAASGLIDRPIFMGMYISSALMLGGLMHYWFTGQMPQQLIDYTHPKSGEKDQYGKDVRLNTMWYTREFEGAAKHIEQQGTIPGATDFIWNKGSGLMEMSKAALTGVDSLGQEIRNPNDPAYKQFEETLASELAELKPITLEAISGTTGSAAKQITLAALGFTPAGKYISETVTEGQISNAYNKFVRPREKPFEAVQMGKDQKDLRKSFNDNSPDYIDKLDQFARKYDLTPKDVRKLERTFSSPKEQAFDPSIFMFSHLPWEAQKPLLDKMTPEERENYLPHISRAKRQKYERETEDSE